MASRHRLVDDNVLPVDHHDDTCTCSWPLPRDMTVVVEGHFVDVSGAHVAYRCPLCGLILQLPVVQD